MFFKTRKPHFLTKIKKRERESKQNQSFQRLKISCIFRKHRAPGWIPGLSRALCHQARPLGNGLAHGSGKFQFISKMSTLQNQKCLHKYHVHSIRQDSETLSKYKQIRSFRKFPSCSRAPGGSGFRAPGGFGDRNAASDPARTAGGAAPQPSASRFLPLPAGLHAHVHPTPQVSCETPARDLVTSDTPPGGSPHHVRNTARGRELGLRARTPPTCSCRRRHLSCNR